MGRPSDHYALLGISRAASSRAIRAAYVTQVKALHPDFTTAENAIEQFQAVQLAYECLRSPERRARYDGETSVHFEWQLSRIDRAKRQLRKLDRKLPVVSIVQPVPHWRAAAVVAASGSLVLGVCYLFLR